MAELLPPSLSVGARAEESVSQIDGTLVYDLAGYSMAAGFADKERDPLRDLLMLRKAVMKADAEGASAIGWRSNHEEK